jgi:hypothetical protein
VFAIIQGGEDGWTTTSVIAAAGIALVALTALVRWERHSNHPMLPLTLFRTGVSASEVAWSPSPSS